MKSPTKNPAAGCANGASETDRPGGLIGCEINKIHTEKQGRHIASYVVDSRLTVHTDLRFALATSSSPLWWQP
jgi:hypothetical protein